MRLANPVITMLGLAALAGCGASYPPLLYEVPLVAASAETASMEGRGDRADDPAIWHHPADPQRSLILGTNKAIGLYVYNIDGDELQRLPVGAVNNVDLRGSLAVASNDGVNGLSWFHIDNIDTAAPVRHLGDTAVERLEPYGVCLGQFTGHKVAAVTYKDGALELWEVRERDAGLPDVRLTRTVQLASQLEGCVFDDSGQRLFVGEENFGIWVLDLGLVDSEPAKVDSIADRNGLVADVEGLSLYIDKDGSGYLLASAQSANRFVVYERAPPHRVIGAFEISASADGAVDAVTHTDGLDVSSAPWPGYPRGLLVAQDDGNPRSGVDQNFKLVSWHSVEAAIEALRLNK